MDGGQTLYSWKHTGAIKLYQATKDMKKVQRQCRHWSITETDNYLRDLGLFDHIRNWSERHLHDLSYPSLKSLLSS